MGDLASVAMQHFPEAIPLAACKPIRYYTSICKKWEFPKLGGYLIGGPHNKDLSTLGSIYWAPSLGKLPKGGEVAEAQVTQVAASWKVG